jgi:hypothetical protein
MLAPWKDLQLVVPGCLLGEDVGALLGDVEVTSSFSNCNDGWQDGALDTLALLVIS